MKKSIFNVRELQSRLEKQAFQVYYYEANKSNYEEFKLQSRLEKQAFQDHLVYTKYHEFQESCNPA